MGKLTFKSNFSLLSSFQVKFERVVNGSGGQKSYQRSILTWSMGMQCENRKVFTWGLTGVNYVYFLGPKHKNAIWDSTPPSAHKLVYMSTGVSTDHKLSNRIKLIDIMFNVCVCMCAVYKLVDGWVGWWVGSCHITSNWINLDLIKII